jgi:hypothetical protein
MCCETLWAYRLARTSRGCFGFGLDFGYHKRGVGERTGEVRLTGSWDKSDLDLGGLGFHRLSLGLGLEDGAC